MTERLWDIPSTWEWTVIKELGDVVSGGTPSTKVPEYWNGDVVWFAPSDLTGYKARTISRGAKSLTDAGLANSSAKVMPAGSVMFSSRAPVGYVAINTVPAATNQGFKSIVPLSGVESDFLYHYLKASKQLAEERATGTTFKELSGSAFGVLPVPVAPTNEQRRIVERIEAMFDEIDHGVENLKKAKATLGLYRQSLLKSAFEGRLTADWRARNADKLEAPETLLARIQKERDTRYKSALDDWQKALTDWRENGEEGKKPPKPKRMTDLLSADVKLYDHGWATIQLGDLIGEVQQGWSPKCDEDRPIQPDDWTVVTTTAVQHHSFSDKEIKLLPARFEPRPEIEIQAGDFLMTRKGPRARTGVVCLIPETRHRIMLCDTVYRFRCDEASILPRLLEFALNSPLTLRELDELKSGISDSGISLNHGKIKSVSVSFPLNQDEQAEITRILNERLSAADALEAEIDAGLTRAEALRQSVLKQAFSGKLVPQDPEDEPAALLLARIKAEKATKPKKRRATNA